MKRKSLILKDREILLIPRNEAMPWDEPWDIILNTSEKENIGYLTFEGEKYAGTVPLKIEIPDVFYHNRGYGTQALRMIIEWAFSYKNVFEITAVCEHHNSAAVMALQKSGFVYRSNEKELETYSIKKQKPSWTGLYVIIGVTVGLILGLVFSNKWVCLIIGLLVGISIGAIMDSKENEYRYSVTGKK